MSAIKRCLAGLILAAIAVGFGLLSNPQTTFAEANQTDALYSANLTYGDDTIDVYKNSYVVSIDDAFYVRCLDLNKKFEDIAGQLHQIAKLVYDDNGQQE